MIENIKINKKEVYDYLNSYNWIYSDIEVASIFGLYIPDVERLVTQKIIKRDIRGKYFSTAMLLQLLTQISQ